MAGLDPYSAFDSSLENEAPQHSETNPGPNDHHDELHAAAHLAGDELDGDQLDIDFTPANYVPDASPPEAADVDDLAAHLKGIDDALHARYTDLEAVAAVEGEAALDLAGATFHLNSAADSTIYLRLTPAARTAPVPLAGAIVDVPVTMFTDDATPASGIESTFIAYNLSSPLLDATNPNVTTDTAIGLAVGPPIGIGNNTVVDMLAASFSGAVKVSELRIQDVVLSRSVGGRLDLESGNDFNLIGGHVQLNEVLAPAGVTDGARIYAEDNGAGKTRLMAIFGTGAAQQIAIEP